jgi:hypothetical protein
MADFQDAAFDEGALKDPLDVAPSEDWEFSDDWLQNIKASGYGEWYQVENSTSPRTTSSIFRESTLGVGLAAGLVATGEVVPPTVNGIIAIESLGPASGSTCYTSIPSPASILGSRILLILPMPRFRGKPVI